MERQGDTIKKKVQVLLSIVAVVHGNCQKCVRERQIETERAREQGQTCPPWLVSLQEQNPALHRESWQTKQYVKEHKTQFYMLRQQTSGI